MSDTMRAEESLRTRQAIAGQALAGPWTVEKYDDSSAFVETTWGNMICDSVSHEEAAHIAANSPDVVMADIDEILRLRAEVEQLQAEKERLEKEADWLAARACATDCIVADVACFREAARKAVEENPCKN